MERYGGDDVGVEEWLKKTKRIKRIKISLIVAAIIAVIVVAIALIVHYAAPSAENRSLIPDESLPTPEGAGPIDDLPPRFSAGVLFRRR